MMRRLLALIAFLPAAALGQTSWVGQRVVTLYGADLIRGYPIEDDASDQSLAAPVHHTNDFCVFRVENASGGWLWLTSENHRVSGWVEAKHVILYSHAIDYCTSQIEAHPKRAYWYSIRGLVWHEEGKLDLAIADYSEAIGYDPTDPIGYYNRGNVWNEKKDHDRALADFNEAIRVNPNLAWVYVSRGATWHWKSDYDKAIADYEMAIKLDPKSALALTNRGFAWNRKRNYQKAIADYGGAIRLDSKSASAFNGRAWLKATCPDSTFRNGPEAFRDASRACRISEWKDAAIIDTLAAAYAECGDFEKAVTWEEKAIKMYVKEEDKKKGEEKRALYREKKPYRNE